MIFFVTKLLIENCHRVCLISSRHKHFNTIQIHNKSKIRNACMLQLYITNTYTYTHIYAHKESTKRSKLTRELLHERSGNLTKNPRNDQREREESTVSNPGRAPADPGNHGATRITSARSATRRKARSCPHFLNSSFTKFKIYTYNTK